MTQEEQVRLALRSKQHNAALQQLEALVVKAEDALGTPSVIVGRLYKLRGLALLAKARNRRFGLKRE